MDMYICTGGAFGMAGCAGGGKFMYFYNNAGMDEVING